MYHKIQVFITSIYSFEQIHFHVMLEETFVAAMANLSVRFGESYSILNRIDKE